MSTLDAAWARAWIDACAEDVANHRVALNELDRAIGDGDHGQNLHRGLGAVTATLAQTPADTPGEVFRLVASGLMSAVGGAAGPLYGTAFLRAAKAAGAGNLDATGLARVLAAAVQGIIDRGEAEPGDKTMVDAWLPAANAARAVAEEGADVTQVLDAAAAAAAQGARDTEPWVARKGRASYLGERARGHRDPGAQSSALMLAAAVPASLAGATEATDG